MSLKDRVSMRIMFAKNDKQNGAVLGGKYFCLFPLEERNWILCRCKNNPEIICLQKKWISSQPCKTCFRSVLCFNHSKYIYFWTTVTFKISNQSLYILILRFLYIFCWISDICQKSPSHIFVFSPKSDFQNMCGWQDLFTQNLCCWKLSGDYPKRVGFCTLLSADLYGTTVKSEKTAYLFWGNFALLLWQTLTISSHCKMFVYFFL